MACEGNGDRTKEFLGQTGWHMYRLSRSKCQHTDFLSENEGDHQIDSGTGDRDVFVPFEQTGGAEHVPDRDAHGRQEKVEYTDAYYREIQHHLIAEYKRDEWVQKAKEAGAAKRRNPIHQK